MHVHTAQVRARECACVWAHVTERAHLYKCVQELVSFNYVNLTCSLKSKAFIYSSTIHFNLLLFNGVFSPLKRKGCIMAVLPLTGK